MAKQVGLVKYSGTMGGVRHFKIKGLDGDFAGLAGGPSAEQIYNDAAFERTRENMSEFGGCASAAKSIRVSLSQILKSFADSRLTGRLTAIMKQINLEDQTEARGQRMILISSQGKFLEGLNFNSSVNFSSVFNAPYSIVINPAKTDARVEIPAFNPFNMVNAPAGATHFRLINAISVISDFAYNSNTRKYEPMDSGLNEISVIEYSSYLDLVSPVPDLTLQAVIPNVTRLESNTSLLCCVGIEFYQQVGPNYYLFNSGNALKIDKVK